MNQQPSAPTDIDILRELTASVTCVLFDFDGPLATLFHGRPAPRVARVLKRRLRKWEGLKDAQRGCKNPLQVVREHADHARIGELEKLLAAQELRATFSAKPTPYADKLVRLLHEQGRTVAITTNNSEGAVANYLRLHGLADYFGRHVYGRPEDIALMKPDPHILKLALESAGAASPADCLMIGDSPDDCIAADKAGVTFLGFANEGDKRDKRKKGDKEAQLRDAGARYVVGSLKPLYSAALAV